MTYTSFLSQSPSDCMSINNRVFLSIILSGAPHSFDSIRRELVFDISTAVTKELECWALCLFGTLLGCWDYPLERKAGTILWKGKIRLGGAYIVRTIGMIQLVLSGIWERCSVEFA